MEEELENWFVSLVGEEKYQSVLFSLFRRDPGEWADLSSLMPGEQIESWKFFVTWLPEPPGEMDGFRMIMLYDTGSGESQTASYNYSRLLRTCVSTCQEGSPN